LYEIDSANETCSGGNDDSATVFQSIIDSGCDRIPDPSGFRRHLSLKLDLDGLACRDDLRVKGDRSNQEENYENTRNKFPLLG